MKRDEKWRLAICGALALGLLVVLSNCGTPAPKLKGAQIAREFEGAPCWVIEACDCSKKTRGMICGVGAMTGTANPALARNSATARATTNIARSLQIHVESWLRDYQATVTGDDEFNVAAADEQVVIDTAKQITDVTLSGVEIVETWISKTGTLYVLAALDTEGFSDSVGRIQNLSEEIRRAVIERAERAWSEQDEAIEEYRNR
ncbi:MAG: LPP20 family lipoprotein [Candidatus Latescibacterota bacterium]|nr:MAG: LPP20 family lipoprotein [Candidatus Latescibacterota bacterium]